MSQYVSIYIKSGEKDPIKIGSYTRNFTKGRYLYDIAPYGSVIELSVSCLDGLCEDIDSDIQREQSLVLKNMNLISSIEKFDNSVDEKFEKIFEIYKDIDDIREEIEEQSKTKQYFRFLQSIIGQTGNKLYFGCEIDENNIKIIKE